METQTWERESGQLRGAYQLEIAAGSHIQHVPIPWDTDLVLGSSPQSDVVLKEPTVSRRHCAFHRSPAGELTVRDLNSRNGVYIGGAMVSEARVTVGMPIFVGAASVVVREGLPPESSDDLFEPLPGIIGQSPAIRRLTRRIRRVSRVSVPVLIQGETGTGKELVARAIHALGAKRDGPFIALNAGALPDELVASELFGHTAGSFTGAGSYRVGAFESADGGTLFLDEVADLSASSQVHLLRVLEHGTFTPVGSSRAKHVNVRVVAATWKPLDILAQGGRFREDLLHRLAVGTVRVPSLDERKSDIQRLASFFLSQVQGELGRKRLRAAALSKLAARPWPGNVRELRNVILRAAIFSDGPWITTRDIQEPEYLDESRGRRLTRRGAENLVKMHGGNISAAAKASGVPRSTFRGWLRPDNG